jgi:hypothetical protein
LNSVAGCGIERGCRALLEGGGKEGEGPLIVEQKGRSIKYLW